MPMPHAMAHIHEIQMRINLYEMKWFLIVKSPDTGNVHRVIAAQNDRRDGTARRSSRWPVMMQVISIFMTL